MCPIPKNLSKNLKLSLNKRDYWDYVEHTCLGKMYSVAPLATNTRDYWICTIIQK